jgi:hypothetical protein
MEIGVTRSAVKVSSSRSSRTRRPTSSPKRKGIWSTKKKLRSIG